MENTNGGMPLEKEPVITENSNQIENNSSVAPIEKIETKATEQQIPNNNEVKSNTNSKSALSSVVEEGNKAQEEALKSLPENWRDIMAAGDDKILKDLQKFKSPADYAKSKRELEILVSKTRPNPELPKNATPEQLKEWREKVGIPEKFEDYNIELKDGFVINEAEKQEINDFLKSSHKNNLTQAEVSKALQAYYESKTERETKMIAAVEQQKQQLQKEWGNNFNSNVNKVLSFLQNEGLQELDNMLMPDGTFALLNPKIVNYFLKLSEKNNGSNTLAPQEGQTFTSIHARIAELEKMRTINEDAFWNNREARAELVQLKDSLKKGNYKN